MSSQQAAVAPPPVDLYVAGERPGRPSSSPPTRAAPATPRGSSSPGRSIKGVFKQADRLGARYVALVGTDGAAELKDMELGRAADRAAGHRHAPHPRQPDMRPPRANAYRDRWAGELRAADVGQTVRVAGWVHRRRDHGGLIFIDLRDRSGLLQLVFHPGPTGFALAESLRSEHVITVGRRGRRPRGGRRSTRTWPRARSSCRSPRVERLASAVTPPFPVDEDGAGRARTCACATASSTCAAPRWRATWRSAHAVNQRHARPPQRARLPRDRDADPHPLDARGRARLPRARPPRARRPSTRCRSPRSCSSSC